MSASTAASVAIEERLTWAQICARHPDQWVVLVDFDRDDDDAFAFRTAIVAGHGPRRADALTQSRAWESRFAHMGHYYTGPVRGLRRVRPRRGTGPGRVVAEYGMPKRTDESPLVTAAIAFDRELVEYGRLAELLLRTSLGTAKNLERANQTIAEIAATEARLRATGQGLATAISEAHGRQQELAEQMIAHLPVVHERNEALRAIVTELKQLGDAMRELSAAASGGAAVREVEERMSELATAAETLAGRARAAGFEEMASQAHAMHQQMMVIGRKLLAVTSRQS